jgi:hypothetical protein
VAIKTTSASWVLVVPSAAVAWMRWVARPGLSSISSPLPATTSTPALTSSELTSADCAAASVLTRWLISGNEILASSMSMSKPNRGARRSSVRTPVDAMNVLDGTQSKSTAAPPTPSESMTVTCASRAAATSAAS